MPVDLFVALTVAALAALIVAALTVRRRGRRARRVRGEVGWRAAIVLPVTLDPARVWALRDILEEVELNDRLRIGVHDDDALIVRCTVMARSEEHARARVLARLDRAGLADDGVRVLRDVR